jgi:uncharacterized protein
MNKNKIIQSIARHVRSKLEGEGTGHDWWHIERVWKSSKQIARKEKADMFVVELGALLHDLYDWKFHGHDYKKSAKAIERLLLANAVEQSVINHVNHIVAEISYKGAKVKNKIKTLEGKIVQDADRLDALGAIGIARAFAYGGHKNRPLYDPSAKAVLHKTFAQYRKGSASTIQHFYEKLLLLKNKMNTKTGKTLAAKRHKFIEGYLAQFYKEWGGKA